MSVKKNINKNYSQIFGSDFPHDLILITILFAAGIVAIYLPILNESPWRYILILPILLFIPGYSLVAAVFPQEGDIDLFERITLSIGLSIAVVILLGLGLNYTPWGIRLEPVVVIVILFTLIMMLVAYYRRAQLPAEKRYCIRIFEITNDIRQGLVPAGETAVDHMLSFILSAVIIIAIITTLFVTLAPNEGERFSEFYILSENLTLSDYPDQIVPGKDYPLYIAVGNQENRDVRYTIETWILKTEFNNMTNTSDIIVMDSDDKLDLTLANNETRLIPYNLSVKKSGYNRVDFLLFNESVPRSQVTGSNRINTSYRNLHLWFTVK